MTFEKSKINLFFCIRPSLAFSRDNNGDFDRGSFKILFTLLLLIPIISFCLVIDFCVLKAKLATNSYFFTGLFKFNTKIWISYFWKWKSVTSVNLKRNFNYSQECWKSIPNSNAVSFSDIYCFLDVAFLKKKSGHLGKIQRS